MFFPVSLQRKSFIFFLLFLLLISQNQNLSAVAVDDPWLPITPEELAMKTPKVEADADAEAIFWEVRIDDSASDELSLKHYIRVKIYTERGREKYSKFDIPYAKGMRIKDLAARVIAPDNTITEIRKEDIFDREIFKADGVKVKAKSFAVPNIGPGVIVEYRYKEAIEDAGANGMRLQLQRDIPVQTLSYYYKPYNDRSPSYQTYNLKGTEFVKDKKGFYLATRQNVPAFKEEPRMPPEDSVRPWMLLQGASISYLSASPFSYSYTIKIPGIPSLYWGAVGTERSGVVKAMNKSNKDIKKLAEELTVGAATAEEKLAKLYEYCQTQIKNTDYDTSLTDEQRRKLPEVNSLSDVIKRKSARSQYIDMLFGSMASSLGMETRLVYSGNRANMLFDPSMTNENLIHFTGVAVRVGDKFKIYNPCTPFIGPEQLAWNEEGVWALLIGEKNYEWVQTPYSDYRKSKMKRTGKFKLSEDGTLEGTVNVAYDGQFNILYKMENYDETSDKRVENLKNEIKAQMTNAEISDVVLENADTSMKPVAYSYKVKIPNYAQKTGKRLFLQPGFFKYGASPQFSAANRKYSIYFRYPWSEQDEVEIEYPKNFSLDSADSPAVISDPEKIGMLDIKMYDTKGASKITYKRNFYFGNGGMILFEPRVYPALKTMFEAFDKADAHTITLKQQ